MSRLNIRPQKKKRRRVSYLFLGSKEGMMQSLFGGKKHAFYRFATVLPIPAIPEEAWISYISRKFKEKEMEINRDPVLAEVIRLSGGHPQDTMLVCSEAYYTLLETGQRLLTSDIVRIALRKGHGRLNPGIR